MSKYKGEEKNNRLVVSKSIEKLVDENNKLSKDLDYITKEEMITAIKKIAAEIGIKVSFTYDQKKHKL